jgi:uncharacterized integral membrane protein
VIYVVLVLFVLGGGLITVLVIENFSMLMLGVHLTLLTWHTPTLPLGILLLLSCVLGALPLYIVTVVSAWRERRELRRLRKRVTELEQAQMYMPAQRMSSSVIVPMPGIRNTRPPYHHR